jgi:hypothetical protein
MLSTRRMLSAAFVALAFVGGAARAQEEAGPIVPDVNQRSGLFTRHVPITPNLPPDPRRDIWQNLRWGERHESTWINSPCNGGLYGRHKWEGECTTCYSPFFKGNPGQSTLNGPDCPPARGRLIPNMLHPFKPVSYYYAGGCYVPIYDLDAQVPGPGPYPWSRLYIMKPVGH